MSKASYNIDNFETAIMGEKRLIRFTICLKSKLLLVSSIGHQGAPVALRNPEAERCGAHTPIQGVVIATARHAYPVSSGALCRRPYSEI